MWQQVSARAARAAPPRLGARPLVYTLRWFGPEDPVTLDRVRQVPGLDGIVTALHDVPAGSPWTPEAVGERVRLLAEHGLRWVVAESVPVSEEIKTAGPKRDEH